MLGRCIQEALGWSSLWENFRRNSSDQCSLPASIWYPKKMLGKRKVSEHSQTLGKGKNPAYQMNTQVRPSLISNKIIRSCPQRNADMACEAYHLTWFVACLAMGAGLSNRKNKGMPEACHLRTSRNDVLTKEKVSNRIKSGSQQDHSQ